MSRRKEKYIPKSFESDGASNDTSANIYMSMLMSESWHNLTKNQQILYVYCKAQYYAEKKKPKPMIRQLTEEELKLCFTMNKSKWCNLYNIYADGGQTRFKADMNKLIENGFIELVENGRTSRTKSIYKFSNLWNKKEQPMAKFIKSVSKTIQYNQDNLYTCCIENNTVQKQ